MPTYGIYDKAKGGRRLFTRKSFGAALTCAQSNADGTGNRRWVRGHGKKKLVKPGGLLRNAGKGAGMKKAFHFRAGGGFADTKMYHLATEARKHAQKLAKDLGRVVRYYMSGGVHHSVKPPKVNPRGGKKQEYRIVPGGGTSRTLAAAKKKAKAYSLRERRPVSVLDLKGMVVAMYDDGKPNPCKPKKPAAKAGGRNPAPAGYSKAWYQRGFRAGVQGRNRDQYTAWHGQKAKPKTSGKRVEAQESFYQGFHDGKGRRKNPAGIGDWVNVKGAKEVRVRRVKGATILDVKT